MQIFSTQKAESDLDELARFYAERDPRVALRLLAAIEKAREHLSHFPESGRPGRVDGTREWIVWGTPFILVYLIRNGSLRLLRVLHHARQWPPTI